MDGFDTACFIGAGDDILDFTLEEEDEAETVVNDQNTLLLSKEKKDPTCSSSTHPDDDDDGCHRSSPEVVEEELEWLSNKDAFPEVETCFGILHDDPDFVFNHDSPVSVLENSSSSSHSSGNSNGVGNVSSIMSCCDGIQVPINYPVRKRSKRRRRRRRVGASDFLGQECLNLVKVVNIKQNQLLPPSPAGSGATTTIGRRCQHCQTDKTPQWRAGPMGPKTLCNACGVRYKSGRLCPEYRPANSPTFSSALHSNSHRKVMEMRRQKQDGIGLMMNNGACGYRMG